MGSNYSHRPQRKGDEVSFGDVTIPSEQIDCLGKTITLRPLAHWQTALLMVHHAPSLLPAIYRYNAAAATGDPEKAFLALAQGLADNRKLIFQLILHSAGASPVEYQKVTTLPAEFHFRALASVMRLTFGVDVSAIITAAGVPAEVADHLLVTTLQ